MSTNGRERSASPAAINELLDEYLHLLGPDHPRTLTTRHELARWRVAARGVDGRAGDG